jgi:hypothetical protein
MSESIFVNGISLDTLAVALTDTSGLMVAPPRRGENRIVAGRHGRIFAHRKRFDEGEITLTLWVAGSLPDGSIPGGSSALQEFEKRRDEVIRAFAADTVTIDYTPDSGLTRRALCEVRERPDVTRVGVEPIAKLSYALTVPGAFWTELSAQSHSASLLNGGSTTVTEFAGATAPMTDLRIIFGPGNNPELGQGEAFIAYDGVIGAGQTLEIDTSKPNDPLTGTGGLTVDYSLLRHGGAAGLFEIWPDSPAPVLTLLHSGGGAMDLTVEGTRRFLTA